MNKEVFHWHTKEVNDIFLKLTSGESGLTDDEAKKRQQKYGINKLPETKRDSYFLIFLKQFKSSLIYILLAASIVMIFLGEQLDAIIIAAVLLFNAIIGTIQEGKAQNTLLALKKFTDTTATVLRNGQEIILSDSEIIPGDIIILSDGDKVPADARLISAYNLKVDEAALTGESEPVKKNIQRLEDDNLTTADQSNMIFKGTYIVGGSARAIVVAIGLDTVVGRISTQLTSIDSEMPLKTNIRQLSKAIIWSVLAINVFLLIIGILYGNSFYEMFSTVVAVSVSIIPEGLPVVITLVLASGVWRMGKRNALVKKLQAVEALGQAKVIAVDKTGTITKNELMISRIFIPDQDFVVAGDGYNPTGEIRLNNRAIEVHNHPDLLLAGKISAYSAAAQLAYSEEADSWRISGDPTEAAILVFGRKVGFKKNILEKENSLIHEIPFDTRIKYHCTIHKQAETNFLSLTGAPEVILKRAQFVWRNGHQEALTDKLRRQYEKNIEAMSAEGLRVLALAFNDNSPAEVTDDSLPPLTLVGFYGMRDVIRSEVFEAMARAEEAGIKVIMITGDHQTTAEAIGRLVGIFKDDDMSLTGSQLESMSDIALDAKIEKVTVFARVTPEHKLRIIEAYKRRGEIIAMTGDGVNDALSLVAADLGVSMSKIGTEVAKEASDIILLDDNFGSIVSAVEEGRSIYQTIKKAVLYLFSTNVGEALVIIGAIIFGWPLPLLASQIIWLNMVTDGFLVAAMALEPKESGLLKGVYKKPGRFLVDRAMTLRIFLMSSAMMIGTLILFKNYLPQGISAYNDELFDMAKSWTVVLTTLAVFQWFNVWNCRSNTRSIFQMRLGENKYLIGATIIVVGLQLLAVYSPFFSSVLRTTPLSLYDWLMIIAFSSIIIIFEEIRKFFVRLKIA